MVMKPISPFSFDPNSDSNQSFNPNGRSHAGDQVSVGLSALGLRQEFSSVDVRPLVSLVVPAYNEALVLEENLLLLCQYMISLEQDYRWEIVLVNDGSRDETGDLADLFARSWHQVRVVHHPINLGLGNALKTGFRHSQGDYVVVLDLDLSYAPDHIERLLLKIRQTHAKIVVTSPYMEGGRVSNVPWSRKVLSVWANRFLSAAVKHNIATLTGMVRVYEANFLKSLNLKSSGMEVNPEIIHKAILMNERIEEIPAHLCWRTKEPPKRQAAKGKQSRRRSSMKIFRHSWSILFYGFLFRPVMFFVFPSIILFGLSMFANTWVLIHCWTNYQTLAAVQPFPDPTEAVAAAFQQAPHTFIIGGMLLMLSIQLFSLGVLSLQSKRYFEEIFYLGSATYKRSIGISSGGDR